MSRFKAGDRVRILDWPSVGHSRVPRYVRGALGHVERVLQAFLIPEDDAFGRPQGRRRVLYRIRLRTRTLWADYRGTEADEVQLEIYEHWLESAEERNERP